MLDILQNLFVLPLIAALIIVSCIYGYYKMSHQDELYIKRDYVRYFLYSYLLALATYYAYQKLMSDASTSTSSSSASASSVQTGGGQILEDVVEQIADSAEFLVDNGNTTYGIATNIMERFNTGRPMF